MFQHKLTQTKYDECMLREDDDKETNLSKVNSENFVND